MDRTEAQFDPFFRLTHSRYATITFSSIQMSPRPTHSCGLKLGVVVGAGGRCRRISGSRRPHLPVGRFVARQSDCPPPSQGDR